MGYTTVVVLCGTALLGACSGMVGSFAVLRRRALLGDALSHAALPGVCLAFLIVGERHTPAMLLGAFLTGILGVAVVTGLCFSTRIKEDAAIGIVLSVFYGAGIALVRSIQNQVTHGSQAGLTTYILGKTSSIVRADVYLIAAVALASLLVVLVLFKEFKIVAFDPDFARVQGWPSFLLDLLLMAMVAVAVVIGLPAVGVVLMAALLIIPAAAARFWTERLAVMLAVAASLGAVMGALGTLLSSRYDWSAGPSVVLVGAGLFAFSVLFGLRRGLVRQLRAEWLYRRRVADESLLRRIYEAIENQLPAEVSFTDELLREHRSAAGRLKIRRWIEPCGSGTWKLTPAGLQQAAETTRAWRMLDLYLAEYRGDVTEIPSESSQILLQQIPRELHDELEARIKRGT